MDSKEGPLSGWKQAAKSWAERHSLPVGSGPEAFAECGHRELSWPTSPEGHWEQHSWAGRLSTL